MIPNPYAKKRPRAELGVNSDGSGFGSNRAGTNASNPRPTNTCHPAAPANNFLIESGGDKDAFSRTTNNSSQHLSEPRVSCHGMLQSTPPLPQHVAVANCEPRSDSGLASSGKLRNPYQLPAHKLHSIKNTNPIHERPISRSYREAPSTVGNFALVNSNYPENQRRRDVQSEQIQHLQARRPIDQKSCQIPSDTTPKHVIKPTNDVTTVASSMCNSEGDNSLMPSSSRNRPQYTRNPYVEKSPSKLFHPLNSSLDGYDSQHPHVHSKREPTVIRQGNSKPVNPYHSNETAKKDCLAPQSNLAARPSTWTTDGIGPSIQTFEQNTNYMQTGKNTQVSQALANEATGAKTNEIACKPCQPDQSKTGTAANIHEDAKVCSNANNPGNVPGLASMRPASWSSRLVSGEDSSNPVHPIDSSSTLESGSLGGEVPLPKELQFSPDILKPVVDGYRAKLVENSKVSKPLLNGWTLYSHQKKVWSYA